MSALDLSSASIQKVKIENNRYKEFINSVPQETIPQGYDLRTLWESSGKPSDIRSAYAVGMIPENENGEFQLPTIDKKTGKWLTPFNGGDMFSKELEFYNSDLDEAMEMKKNYHLDTSGEYWKYAKREEGEVPIYNEQGLTVGRKTKDGKTIIDKKKPVLRDGKFVGFYNTTNSKFEPLAESDYQNEPSITRLTQKGSKFTKHDAIEEDYASQEDLVDLAKGKYAEKARSMRKGSLDNNDGTDSTHRMAYAEVDGKYVAYPTLFQNEDGSWYDKKGEDKFAALREAKKRGESFTFNTEKEAKEFAGGNWKQSEDEIPEAMTPPQLVPKKLTRAEAMARINAGEKYNVIRN